MELQQGGDAAQPEMVRGRAQGLPQAFPDAFQVRSGKESQIKANEQRGGRQNAAEQPAPDPDIQDEIVSGPDGGFLPADEMPYDRRGRIKDRALGGGLLCIRYKYVFPRQRQPSITAI